MDLLAQATLPDATAGTIHAEVRADIPESGDLRLVIQSFEDGSNRPIGSVQRAVTAEELRKGVCVRVVEIRRKGVQSKSPRVLAWVERGHPDLELDARLSRPSARAYRGESVGTDVRIVLRSSPARAA
jgi:hypothetical protein